MRTPEVLKAANKSRDFEVTDSLNCLLLSNFLNVFYH